MTQIATVCILMLVAVCIQFNNASTVESFDYSSNSEIGEVKDTWIQELDDDLERSASCSCHENECNCCLRHKFKVKIWFKRFTIKLDACLNVQASGSSFIVEFKFNGKHLGSRHISLHNIPTLCYKIPGFHKLGKACVEFYDVSASSRRMCSRLTFQIKILSKKFSYKYSLGCFTVPMVADDNVMMLTNESVENDEEDQILMDPFYNDDDSIEWE
ncbi:hypothetical protein ACF0H5_012483 [Mactra antiquata]